INAIMSGRRGQILGFDTREGWTGWDVVRALMAESEIGDLIIEGRSATAGVGTFTAKFDHMDELSGKTAEHIAAARQAARAAADALSQGPRINASTTAPGNPRSHCPRRRRRSSGRAC